MSSEQVPPVSRKKAKGYFVKSRYLQAAEATGQSSREKSPNNSTAKGHSKQYSFEKSSIRFPRDGNTSTPKSSTPENKDRHALPLPPIETSAIDASGFLQLPGETKKNVTNKSRSRTGPSKTKDTTLSVTEHNILYAQYLQAKFLESSAVTAMEKRAENGLEKIYQAWCCIQKLMIQNAKLEKDLSLLHHLIELNEHLTNQEEMLLPVLEIIPELEGQYESIAKAVDIVRRKLEVKNMSLPQDKESEEEVMGLLSKISSLIQSFKSIQNSEEVIACASVSKTFSQQGELIYDEIKRAENLLSEVNAILVDETVYKLAEEN